MFSHSDRSESRVQPNAYATSQNAQPNGVKQLSRPAGKTMQLRTEVEHFSKHQPYWSSVYDDVIDQKMGVKMEAWIDPWEPLQGTETGAFTRHGIYLDDAYKDGKRRATALHLLNANLGGLAMDENLFPGTTNKNGQHLKAAETGVKNQVLTLRNFNKRGFRVYYQVGFNPASLLTPDNFEDTPMPVEHHYVDPNNTPVHKEHLISLHPNTELENAGWGAHNTDDRIGYGGRVYENPFAYNGDRSSYTQIVRHALDPNSDAQRLHTHWANEDIDNPEMSW